MHAATAESDQIQLYRGENRNSPPYCRRQHIQQSALCHCPSVTRPVSSSAAWLPEQILCSGLAPHRLICRSTHRTLASCDGQTSKENKMQKSHPHPSRLTKRSKCTPNPHVPLLGFINANFGIHQSKIHQCHFWDSPMPILGFIDLKFGIHQCHFWDSSKCTSKQQPTHRSLLLAWFNTIASGLA